MACFVLPSSSFDKKWAVNEYFVWKTVQHVRLDETSYQGTRRTVREGRDELPAREVSWVQPSIVHHLQICKCNPVVCVFFNLIIFVHRSPKGEE